jgi:molybdopterin-containing oxidoreductase family iron-sulfur binding subunit
MNDPASKVTVAKADERGYGILAYLGTRPRTSYLGRVRNPNMAMPGAANIGHTSVFHEEAPDDKGGSDKPAGAPTTLNDSGHARQNGLNQEKLTG